MNILPGHTEIIVSALQPHEITETLKKAVEPEPRNRIYHRFSDQFPFTGAVLPGEFRIIPFNEGSDYFVPRIIGRIEPSGNGSMIFMEFRMAKLTRLTLIFFIVVSILILVFFLLYRHRVYIGVTAFIAGIINYVLALRNFKASSKRVKGKILWLLNLRKKLIS